MESGYRSYDSKGNVVKATPVALVAAGGCC